MSDLPPARPELQDEEPINPQRRTAEADDNPTPVEVWRGIWVFIKDPHHSNALVAIFTILLFVTTFTYTIFAALQWAAMRETLSEMKRSGQGASDQTNKLIGNTNWLARETMNAVAQARNAATANERNATAALDASIAASRMDQRAWMNISPAADQRRLIDNTPLTETITISNVGKTPALEVLTKISVQLVPLQEKPDFVYEPGHPHNVDYAAVIFPNSPHTDSFSALRHGQKGAEPVILTTEALKRIESDSLLVVVHGRTTFMDIFKQRHWLTFCFQRGITYSQAPSVASKTCSDYNHIDGQR